MYIYLKECVFHKTKWNKSKSLPFIGRQRTSSSRHTPSPIRRSSIFRTREVILLPTANKNEVVRGQRKNLLMSEGFVRSELDINKNWDEKEVIEFFESCFSDKLEPIQKVDGRNRSDYYIYLFQLKV